MTEVLVSPGEGPAVPIHPLDSASWTMGVDALGPRAKAAAGLSSFRAAPGSIVQVVDPDGGLERVLLGVGAPGAASAMIFRCLPASLPAGTYRIAAEGGRFDAAEIAVAWRLGAYRYDRFRPDREPVAARLEISDGVDPAAVRSMGRACDLIRDMVNTPAGAMGPGEVEDIARGLAETRGATMTVIRGADLPGAGYPLVHAVGRAAIEGRAPRFMEITWGAREDPRLVLIGKGVVFDTGGLDLKPSAGMRLMKKDMGGAAHALGLAGAIMDAGLPVRLHVLLPVVENAIAADAMRPGDVEIARNGLSVEIGNTDAEGRLILADALVRASELSPALTVVLATLTGAARVALGPDIVPFYTDDDGLAADLSASSRATDDPIWRMPLWDRYGVGLESDIAQIKNDPDAWLQAGSIAGALFLKRFAPLGPWVHFDIFAWNPRARPGFPIGAEVQAARALFSMIRGRWPC